MIQKYAGSTSRVPSFVPTQRLLLLKYGLNSLTFFYIFFTNRHCAAVASLRVDQRLVAVKFPKHMDSCNTNISV